jgi:hypothetical protein
MKRNDTDGEIATVSRAWTKQQIHRTVSLSEEKNSFQFRLSDGKVSAAVNGKTVFRNARPPGNVAVCDSEILLGVGAFNDMNDTVIRYRNLQVRRLLPGKTAASE